MNERELEELLKVKRTYNSGEKPRSQKFPYRGDFPHPRFRPLDRVVLRESAQHLLSKKRPLKGVFIVWEVGRMNTDLNPILDTTSPWVCFLHTLAASRVSCFNEDFLELEWIGRIKQKEVWKEENNGL